MDGEPRAIAEGAGVGYELGLAVGSGWEMSQLAAALGSSPSPAIDYHLLGIVVAPAQSTTAGLLMAQTRDTPAWAAERLPLTVEHADEALLRPDVGTQAWVKKKRPKANRYDSLARAHAAEEE